MAWWRHNCITLHFTKFYFIQLLLKIKYAEFEDRPKNVKNLRKYESFSYRRVTDKRIYCQELEKVNIGRLSAKLRTTGSIEHTVMIDFKMCCLFICPFSFTR